MKKVFKGEKYLLHWTKNMSYWNKDLEEIKKIRDDIVEVKGRYYTIVYPHFTGIFEVVDCSLDLEGNYYPVNTSLLKDYDNAYDDE